MQGPADYVEQNKQCSTAHIFTILAEVASPVYQSRNLQSVETTNHRTSGLQLLPIPAGKVSWTVYRFSTFEGCLLFSSNGSSEGA